MPEERDVTVFSRLRDALAMAAQEEAEFAAEVTADDPEGEASYRAFSDWAGAVFESTSSLRLTPEMRNLFRDEVAPTLDDSATHETGANLPFVRPLIELQLARLGVNRIQQGTDRLYKLLKYLVEADDLQPRAQSYLGSVARLYIWGFNNEAVVLARAALEAALEERLGRVQGQLANGMDLLGMIRTAGPDDLALLDRAALNDAQRIRRAANQSLHVQLGTQELDALQAIEALARILSQLFPNAM